MIEIAQTIKDEQGIGRRGIVLLLIHLLLASRHVDQLPRWQRAWLARTPNLVYAALRAGNLAWKLESLNTGASGTTYS